MTENITIEGQVPDIGNVTIDEILARVGDDPGAAQMVKELELERGTDARKTLLKKLDAVIEAAAQRVRASFVDGGEETLPVPDGATVAVVTDRTNGRVIDPAEYEATDDGLVKTAGGTWARGRMRWSLDFEE